MKDLGELTPEQSLDVITKQKSGNIQSRTTKRKASARRPNRPRGPSNPNRKRSGAKDSVERQWLDGKQKPFIGWDGEGYNAFVCDSNGEITVEHRYMLFGSSHSEPVIGKNLSTLECLRTILEVESRYPNSYHIGFSFEYDVNMILKDLPQRHMRNLKKYGRTRYCNYRIEHVPHVHFKVRKDKVCAKIYDVFKFFNVSYLTALEKFGVGNKTDLEIIEQGKKRRADFTFADIDDIERYWRSEIKLLPELADAIREACYRGGFFITDWHGPGAIARYLCKHNNVQKYMSTKNSQKVPTGVKIARQAAYAGGRFHGFRAGNFSGPVYVADINGAYIYAGTKLPRLDNGRWERADPNTIRGPDDIQDYGLYRIHYNYTVPNHSKWVEHITKNGFLYPQPLFHRDKGGGLSWPYQTEGWFWSPEAKLVAGSHYAKFLEAWVYVSDNSFPFADWINSAHARRINLQKKGDPAERGFKWGLAAIYGQWAQRIGWNPVMRTPPRTHQIEWAGYMTSWCRAEVWKVAKQVASKGGLISIDTDGVCATVPFIGLEEGDNLGQWKLEEYSGIIQWQTSMYWLRDKDGVWKTPKTRGIKRGKVSREIAEKEIARLELARGIKEKQGHFMADRKSFWGYGRALTQNWNKWRTWETIQSEWSFGGKIHHPHFCVRCMNPGHPVSFMHTLIVLPPDEVENKPHRLPWLESDKEELIPEGATILDIHHIDEYAEWDKLEIYHENELKEEW